MTVHYGALVKRDSNNDLTVYDHPSKTWMTTFRLENKMMKYSTISKIGREMLKNKEIESGSKLSFIDMDFLGKHGITVEPRDTHAPEKIKVPADWPVGKNCGLVAAALALQLPYDTAVDTYLSYETNDKHAEITMTRGGTHTSVMRKVLYNVLGRTLHLNGSFKGTLKKFAELTRNDGKWYMVYTKKHVQIISGGYVSDQRGCVKIEEYAFAQSQVREICDLGNVNDKSAKMAA